MKKFLLFGAALIAASVVQASRDDPERTVITRQLEVVKGSGYMVAAANPHAVTAGEKILAAGGSAMDAAVAVQTTLGLVEPQSSGIGGGAFILYWSAKDQKLYTLDARERAPAAASADQFYVDGKPLSWRQAIVGGMAVGVPGIIKGLETAQQRFGKLPWQQLFDHPIDLATRGFEVSPRLAMLVAMKLHPGLTQLPPANDYFYPQGEPIAAGSILKNTDYANTLTAIAKHGSKAFYQGELAQQIANSVQQAAVNPGRLTKQDLSSYQATWREPLCGPYREYQVCGMMPPSSGGLAVLQMLGILQHFPIDQYDLNDADLWHLYSQASRIAFADRERYAADADFVDVPLKALLAPHYLEARAQSINMQTDMGTAQALELDQKLSYANDDSYSLPSTSHFVIIDAEGNAVSMTTSIEMAFGSSLMVGGFLLNNQLTDFSLSYEREGKLVANRVEPGKRPRSSMSPMMVFKDEQPVLLVGSPGGSRIINYVAKTLIAHLDLGLDIQQSVNAPNVSHTNGKALMLEEGLVSETLAEQLRQKGHTIQMRDMNSGVHAIAIKGNNFYGAADPRREGMVATAPN